MKVRRRERSRRRSRTWSVRLPSLLLHIPIWSLLFSVSAYLTPALVLAQEGNLNFLVVVNLASATRSRLDGTHLSNDHIHPLLHPVSLPLSSADIELIPVG